MDDPGQRSVAGSLGGLDTEHAVAVDGTSVHLGASRLRDGRALSGDGRLVDRAGAVDDDTVAIAVVSPNNPTGLVATHADLKRLAVGAPDRLLIVDLAYAEFAEDDSLLQTALSIPNGRSAAGGLPTGIQLVGPRHADARVLAHGAALEALLADAGTPEATEVDYEDA